MVVRPLANAMGYMISVGNCRTPKSDIKSVRISITIVNGSINRVDINCTSENILEYKIVMGAVSKFTAMQVDIAVTNARVTPYFSNLFRNREWINDDMFL